MAGGNLTVRKARMDERAALEALIAASARELGGRDYSRAQLDRAIGNVFGVDSELIEDGTYLVAEIDGAAAGCGGWSRRKTLFGADGRAGRDPGRLDPAKDAARIRAFFVHPDFARRGVGRALYDRCEMEARAAGFGALELMATLGGIPLYSALGFEPAASIDYDLGAGLSMRFVPMRKVLPTVTVS
ncbi:MAG TPA: GNAT family N-acetyltransferase [Caulobacteraceae bacterium]|jgi:GNAT superfamily N-acetyltransferase|nr:GNAT family N-acetyltransferase [Caulobacteraceae bacterium]